MTSAVPREAIEDTSCSSECVILGRETPNVAVKWLTLLVLIPELPGSNLGPETSYPHRGFVVVFKSPKKGDKTACNNYRGISLLPTTYKSLSSILLSRLIPYAEEIIGDHQCGFRRNRSATDHIFCIRQILEKKWEHNGAVHQLFIDFKKAYDSVRREALYNILIEFGIPKKMVSLMKSV